jgi:hypothetical protein
VHAIGRETSGHPVDLPGGVVVHGSEPEALRPPRRPGAHVAQGITGRDKSSSARALPGALHLPLKRLDAGADAKLE